MTVEDFDKAMEHYSKSQIDNILASATGARRDNIYPYISEDTVLVTDKDGKSREAWTRESREFGRGKLQKIEYSEDYADILRRCQSPYMNKYYQSSDQTQKEKDNINILEQQFSEKTGFEEMPLLTESEIFSSAKKVFGDDQIDSRGIIKISMGYPETTGVWADGYDFVNPEVCSGLILYYSSLDQIKGTPKLLEFYPNHYFRNDYSRTYDKPKFHPNSEESFVNNNEVSFVNPGLYRLMDDGTYVNVSTFARDEKGELHFETHTYDEILEECQKTQDMENKPEISENTVRIMKNGITELLSEEEYAKIMDARAVAASTYSQEYQLLENAHNQSIARNHPNHGVTLNEIASTVMESFKEDPNKETEMGAQLDKGVEKANDVGNDEIKLRIKGSY